MILFKSKQLKEVQETMNKVYRKERITEKEFVAFHEHLDSLKRNLQELEDFAPKITKDCPGEAHSNAHIDNCMLCAPLWNKTLKSECKSAYNKE